MESRLFEGRLIRSRLGLVAVLIPLLIAAATSSPAGCAWADGTTATVQAGDTYMFSCANLTTGVDVPVNVTGSFYATTSGTGLCGGKVSYEAQAVLFLNNDGKCDGANSVFFSKTWKDDHLIHPLHLSQLGSDGPGTQCAGLALSCHDITCECIFVTQGLHVTAG